VHAAASERPVRKRIFASDNWAGAHPRIIDAIARCAKDSDAAYGEDDLTRRVERRIADIFERECAVFLVGTGTAANALALAALTPPYGAIYCHPDAHINTDESGAPEMYTGAKLVTADGPHGKIDPGVLQTTLDEATVHGVHRVKPALVCLTNQTELGAVYTPSEISALSGIATSRSLGLFQDGARFANAVSALGRSPAEMTWKAGVDAMTFGATKNGAVAAEAIVFFHPEDARDFGHRRKRGGQLWSKLRFLSAQFDAYLDNDLWLTNAAHANAMARRMATDLTGIPGVTLVHPADGNEVFVAMPEEMIVGLERDGFVFYRWGPGFIRLVTMFTTTAEDVDDLTASARRYAAA
jgi:threonine aldolase